jgi:ketosteroid isomerase-like protein
MRGVGWSVAGVVLLGLACQPAEVAETPEAMQARLDLESAAFRSAVEAMGLKTEQWEAAGLTDSILSMYAEDAVVAFSNQPVLRGHQAMRENAAAMYALGTASLDLRTENASASGPLGVERGTYVYNFTPGPNAPPAFAAMFPDSGSYLTHWHLMDGQWKIVELVVNSMKPHPAMGM